MVYSVFWHIVHLLHVISGRCSGPCQGLIPSIRRHTMPGPAPANPEQCCMQHSHWLMGRPEKISFSFCELSLRLALSEIWFSVVKTMQIRRRVHRQETPGDTHSHRQMSPDPAGTSRSDKVFLADIKHVMRRDETRDRLRDMSRESSQFPSCCHTVHFLSYELTGLSRTSHWKFTVTALAPLLETIRLRNSSRNIIWWNEIKWCVVFMWNWTWYSDNERAVPGQGDFSAVLQRNLMQASWVIIADTGRRAPHEWRGTLSPESVWSPLPNIESRALITDHHWVVNRPGDKWGASVTRDSVRHHGPQHQGPAADPQGPGQVVHQAGPCHRQFGIQTSSSGETLNCVFKIKFK